LLRNQTPTVAGPAESKVGQTCPFILCQRIYLHTERFDPVDETNRQRLTMFTNTSPLAPQDLGLQFTAYRLDKALQRELIAHVLNTDDAARALGQNASYPIWTARSVRRLRMSSVPRRYHERKFSQVEYIFRHHPQSEWEWNDDALSIQVRSIVESFVLAFPLFVKLTRVKIHLQKPRLDLSLHRDLTVGQYYGLAEPLAVTPGPHRLRYQAYDWVDLADFDLYTPDEPRRNQFSLKIPLSDDGSGYGRQLCRTDQIREYTSDGHYYLLNETIDHGASGVAYARGLVFVDGILDLEVLSNANAAALRFVSPQGAAPEPARLNGPLPGLRAS
jgi:hypothetical protein